LKDNLETYNIFYDPNIDLSNSNNWLSILSNLMEDIIVLYKYKIPVSSDSTNYVLVKTNDLNLISSYEIRYFGFDFTTKISPIKINTKEICWTKNNSASIRKFHYYHNILFRAIEALMFYAVNVKYNHNNVILPPNEKKALGYLQSYFGEILDNLYYKNSQENYQ
jgi:hypothetical protein